MPTTVNNTNNCETVNNIANNVQRHNVTNRVSLDTVFVGMHVRRNTAHWRRRWKDDGGEGCVGVVIGFTDNHGVLVGQDSNRKYETDRIGLNSTPGWAVVSWQSTGLVSVYPIGSDALLGKWWRGGACYSLLEAERKA